MRKIAAYAQAAVLVLTTSLAAPSWAPAQRAKRPEKPATDPRLQDLINERKGESWNYLETQLKPTHPPRSQPVTALPEWHPAGGVILTLDTDYYNSFKLNNLLKTEGKGAEVFRRDPAATRHIEVGTCNALYSAQEAASESVRRDAEVTAYIAALCPGMPASQRQAIALPGSGPEHAEVWLRYLFRVLERDALLSEISHAHTFLQIVKSFVPHTKVLILVPGQGRDEDSLYGSIGFIKNFPGGGELLKSKNVQFVQINVNSKWIRDYGPIFIRNGERQILCVDPRYNTSRQSLEERRRNAEQRRQNEKLLAGLVKALSKNGEGGGQGSQEGADDEELSDQRSRRDDDVIPSLLASRLRQRNGNSLLPNPINVVRPPMALDGGDFFTDGNGVGFTSTETLQLNGGNLELLNLMFRDYFGLKDVVYLQPLPGSTVKHIDMFFKVVSPEIILLGRFENIGSNKQRSALQAEAQRALDYNLKVLKNFYEGRGQRVNVVGAETDGLRKGTVNIVLVPMPDLRRPAREMIAKLEQELARLAGEHGLHSKAADKALRRDNSLGDSLASLQRSAQSIADDGGKVLNSSAAKTVALAGLKARASEVASALRELYAEFGAETKAVDWDGGYRRLVELADYLDAQKAATARNLKSADRRVLASYLRGAADSLQSIVTGLQPLRAESKRAHSVHAGARDAVAREHQLLSAQKGVLEQRLPYGLDIYHTYLNALQVKTARANLLLVPTYADLDAMEKRALGILRRVYTRAHGATTVIPIDSDYFMRQSGSIHCLAQTLPAEVDVFSDDWNFRSRLNAK